MLYVVPLQYLLDSGEVVRGSVYKTNIANTYKPIFTISKQKDTYMFVHAPEKINMTPKPISELRHI
jgi:hypothetical protein